VDEPFKSAKKRRVIIFWNLLTILISVVIILKESFRDRISWKGESIVRFFIEACSLCIFWGVPDQGSMLKSQFSAILADFRRFSQKPMLWSFFKNLHSYVLSQKRQFFC
jgi:hypothetical protein